MLVIPQEILDDIFVHSEETYPEECCGILVGHDAEDRRIISGAHRSENVSRERRHERYVIDEKKLLEVSERIRGLSVDVIGFYHSHPDYPSSPSGYDTETAAWPGYSYLIVSVEKGRVASARSWIMHDGGDSFVEQPTSIEEHISQ